MTMRFNEFNSMNFTPEQLRVIKSALSHYGAEKAPVQDLDIVDDLIELIRSNLPRDPRDFDIRR